MKRRSILKKLSGVLLICAFSSCSTPTLYCWHDYVDSAYKHTKLHTEKTEKNLDNQFEKMLTQQSNSIRKTPPPGINAEYGFLLLNSGKTEDAKSYFKNEILLYPESELFISNILKQIQ